MAHEPAQSIYEQKIDLIGSVQPNDFAPRFLNPVAKTPIKPAPNFQPTHHSTPQIKHWNHPPNIWAEWVDQMAGKYSSIWMKSGILESIMTSIYEINCNHDVISALLHHWNPKTNTFVFPWGEATVTLEDVTILGGYSVLGDSVNCKALMADLAGKLEEMNKYRLELVGSKSKKASHCKWIQMFMGKWKPNQTENENEHVAFLSLWLSRFVFPSLDRNTIGKHVFPITVLLSQGKRLDLATAILAGIYRDLTIFKKQSISSSSGYISLLGPFMLVQIWAYERFPIIGPKTPNELHPGEPRLARWHKLNSKVNLDLLHSHIIDPENFVWRPYAIDLKNWVLPIYYEETEQIISDYANLDDNLKSFVRFLQHCEIDGLSYREKYMPHRVAMQFGFDQDIPGDFSGYKLSNFVKFLVPSRSFKPGVSKRYANWWKNLNQESDQELLLDEQKDCDKHYDLHVIDLEDKFDGILMNLKNICNDTQKKIDSLKGSYVGDSRSKKRMLVGELGNVANDVIQID